MAAGPSGTALLVRALDPVLTRALRQGSLQPGEVSHRAILGQVTASLVEELQQPGVEAAPVQRLLVSLAAQYMDKVLDVLLVQFQPTTPQPLVSCVLCSVLHCIAIACSL